MTERAVAVRSVIHVLKVCFVLTSRDSCFHVFDYGDDQGRTLDFQQTAKTDKKNRRA